MVDSAQCSDLNKQTYSAAVYVSRIHITFTVRIIALGTMKI